MKPYLVTYKFYYDGELLREGNYRQLREAPYEEEYSGTDFEGLWNLTNKYSIEIPLGMWEFKRAKDFYSIMVGCLSKSPQRIANHGSLSSQVKKSQSQWNDLCSLTPRMLFNTSRNVV